ncbi:protein of unknown function [Azospirillum baldaniorum]|uniref:Uncharacterized protein n=1 Tax=Azospirillum baldaniorum TaxID=1064539 RepID=A0A9P1JP07_9PROT|nr:protein of unknown function [Azospirillum baldaniorum]
MEQRRERVFPGLGNGMTGPGHETLRHSDHP